VGVVNSSLANNDLVKRIKSTEPQKENKDDRKDFERQTRKKRRESEEDIDSDEDDKTQCVICMYESREVLFVPCGHVCSCTKCAEDIETCPMCRATIKQSHRAYIS
jgi:hypothetical protein